ncbi:MAG: HYR domain-containing protein [Saprospirales bacterium]|nr:HYR domain-containing protein [Saprospirales bacterium]
MFVAGTICPQEGTYTNTWTVTDACGNQSMVYTQIITITDNTPPAATAPTTIDIECSTVLPAAATTITAFLALPGASASDLCSPTAELKVESSTTILSGTQCSGVISRTYVITDQCGNSTAVTQTINVTDNTAPEITCPAPQTIKCEDSQLPTNTGSATATDNCSTAPVIMYTDNLVPGACPDAYTIERTWKATDDCGNTATCLQLIIVQDITPPVITCPADLAVNCQDSSLPANTGTATATDNCDDEVTISSTDEIIPGNCPDTYTIKRTWTATDDCNNSTTCVQTILVQDVQKPVISFCPPDITINCEVDPTPANTGGPAVATDNCDQSVTVESSDLVVPGNCPDRRRITRTWTATDNCGNSTSCVQVIEVQDMTAPTITYCPPDITLSCDVDPLVLTNTNGSATATDNCDTEPTITFLDTFEPGSCFPSGVITRRWAAVDNCLNANSTACIQKITIIDNTAPVISCPGDVTIECDESLDPGENDDLGFATATDNCDPNRVISYTDVRADGPCLFEYTVTRTWTATDACGNTDTCVQTITVDDTTPPIIICPADQTVECGSDVSPAVLGEPTATDNCGLAGISTPIDDTQPFGDCPLERRITRLWVAIDLCGNPAPCQQVITVVDNTLPVLVCVDKTVECNESTAPANTGIPTATDNCDQMLGTPSIFSETTVPSQVCPQEYQIIRVWSLADACDNTGFCTQIITVDDDTDPVITCPGAQTVECDESTDPADTGMATATDNCTLPQDIVIVYSDLETDVACPQAYTITRTWTATDLCGNSTDCVQTITVEDTTPPVIADDCPLLNTYGNPMPNTATYVVGTSDGGPCPALALVNLSVGESYPADYEIKVGDIPVPGLLGCMEDNCADPDDVLARVEAIAVTGNDCQKFFDIEFILVDPCGNESEEFIHYIIEVLDDTAPVPPNPPAPAFFQCPDEVPAPGPLTALDNCAGDITVTGVDTDNEGAGCANDPLIITRSWTFDDGCGNSVTIEQIITVADTEAPVFTACPPTATVECGQDESPMATGVPEATDNCDDGVSFDYSDLVETTAVQCPVVKRITRTWTAYDDCGNQNASCVQTILVLDGAPPLIDCPDDLTLACDGDPSPANTGMAVALDACDPTPTIVWEDEGATTPCVNDTLAKIIRTWFAFDECGNVAVCDQEIALIDELAPVITCPADTVINCEVLPTPANTGTATATDNCDLEPAISILNDSAEPDPDCPQGRVITRSWQAADLCGNIASCEQIITVQDTTRPLLICPADMTVQCDESTEPANTGVALAQDNCDPEPVVTHTDLPPVAGNCPGARVFKRTWLAGDGCDNGALCVQTIAVRDTKPPVLVCPPDQTVECDQDPSAALTGTPTVTDNCDPEPSAPTYVDGIILSTVCLQERIITRTWSSTDACGNTGTCAQTVTVDDSTDPVITCPPAVPVECDDSTEPAATGFATATDNCDMDPGIDYSDVSTQTNIGACSDYTYTITRTWTAVDACGNETACEQIISVADTKPPVITCPPTATINCEELGQIPAITGSPTVTDNCDPEPPFILLEMNGEPDPLCPQNATLTLVWKTVDYCNNMATCEQTVIMQDITPPVIACPAGAVVECNTSTVPAATGTATATDNCDGDPAISSSDAIDEGDCPQEYTITRTWTATDACGNSAQCEQTIEVVDTKAPLLSCPANLSISCEVPAIPANTGMATATDNCDTAPDIDYSDVSTQTSNGTCSDQSYTITRTWTAVDACGNQALACTQTIILRDITAPVIICPPPVAVGCDDSLDPAENENLGEPTISDNCDPEPGFDYTDAALPGTPVCPEIKVILRTWLTIDNCQNPAACSQRIAIVDLEAPQLTCPDDITVNCDDDYSVEVLGSATAIDACDPQPLVTYNGETSEPGDCQQEKTIFRAWTAVDDCGNSTLCVQTIFVQDTTPPTITCPPPATVQCDENIDPQVNPNVGVPTVTDNYATGLVPGKIDTDLGLNGCTRTILRNWIVSDICNAAAACSQFIYLTDSQGPVLDCPADVTVECDESTDPFVNENLGAATATDNCDMEPSVDYSDETDEQNCGYIITRTWTAADACGNSNSVECVQTITVTDTTPPVFTSCPADMTVDCGDELDPFENTELGVPMADDNCDDDLTLSYDDATTLGNCLYLITRTWKVVDDCGNPSSASACVQVITLEDNAAPTISCPSDATVECTASLDPYQNTALGLASGQDDCAGLANLTYADGASITGQCPVTKVFTRTWTILDACGNSASCDQTITLEDHTPPTVICPAADLTLECGNPDNAALIAGWLASATANDACSPATTANNYSPTAFIDGCGNTGVQIVTFSATDACGNSSNANCTKTISILDNTPPAVTCPPADLTLECGSTQNGALIDAWLASASASDACGGATVSNNYSPTAFSDGCGLTGMQTVTFQAFDACQNSSTANCSKTIAIVDNTPPVVTCPPADLTLECGHPDNPGRIDVWLGLAKAEDNCGPATVSNNFSPNGFSDGCGNTGMQIVNFQAFDACQNSSTANCTRTIVIVDNTAPVVICPQADLTLECADPNNAALLADWLGSASATDACGGTTVSNSFSPNGFSDGCGNTGVQIVSFSATDACGNSSTANCSKTVSILDTKPPVVACPAADLTLECGNPDNPTLINGWLASATATDACGTATVSNTFSPTAFSDGCGNTGAQTVTFRAFDACQNSSTTCSKTISIVDTKPPVVACPPNDLTLECGSTQNGALINAWLASATASDACGAATVSNNFSPNNFSDDCGFTGMQTVIFQAFDECQNSSAPCSKKISIVDNTPPTFTVPADLTLYQDENCNVNPGNNLGDVTDESDNCSGGNLQATFTETVEPGPGLTERTVYRVWKLTDDCGNMTVKTQTIAIRDTLLPTLTCPTGFQTGANTDTCTFAVLGQALDPGMIDDNCGVLDTAYTLSGATTGSGSNTLEGEVLEPGTTIVTWTVTDVNGNTATCSYPVYVADCVGITGRIIWEGNDFDTVGVAQVTVTLTGDDSTATGPTPPSGYYTLVPAMGNNYMITPAKPGPLTTITVDPMNGVTADDAQAILLHVFNTMPITDPYKLIAADVNMSNSVTRDDEVLIRRALLGSETALLFFQNKPWRFVPDTTDTPWSLGYHPPLNPFSAPIPSKRTLTGAGGGAANQNFYGIKTGDVNATANPLLKPAQLNPLYFRVQDRVLTAGEEMTVTVRVANFADWAGFQLALQADPGALEIIGVETSWSPLGLTEADNFGLYDAKAGEIRSIWLEASGRTLLDGAPVFALRFKALQSGIKLSEVLRLKPKALEPLAFTADQARAPLQLVFTEVQTTATADPAAGTAASNCCKTARTRSWTARPSASCCRKPAKRNFAYSTSLAVNCTASTIPTRPDTTRKPSASAISAQPAFCTMNSRRLSANCRAR